METGKVRYTADKPEDCAHCYFWQGKKGCCERKECYYLMPPVKEQKAVAGKEIMGDCRFCPYGKHSPCIGFCLAKILQEMKDSHGK